MSDQPDKEPADTEDTKQAPPSQEPETTIVASGTTTVDRNELAWSVDETDEIQSTRHGRIVSAGLIALLAGISDCRNTACGNIFRSHIIETW